MAFRLQHDRLPRRGREAELEGEDALAKRIARAVPLAQQQEELRSQFGDFLDAWMNADAARDAALEAAQSALQEGMASRLQHDRLPRRGREAELEGEDALAKRIARAVPLAQQQEALRSQFGNFLDAWMNADAARDAALEAAQSALQEGMAFCLQHDRLPRRGREAELEGEDALAKRIARAVPLIMSLTQEAPTPCQAVPLAQQQVELRPQFGDFLDAWMHADAARDAALEAARSALQEGLAFRLQHDRLPRRGREAELEGEDALAQRIARAVPLIMSLTQEAPTPCQAVPLAQQQVELRSQFGDFLDAWMHADAARDAALEAARSALQEGLAFRLLYGRHPRRGRQPELEEEDALAQRIQRGVVLAEQEQSIAVEFAEFLLWWKNEIVASEGSFADVFGGRGLLDVLEPLSCHLFCSDEFELLRRSLATRVLFNRLLLADESCLSDNKFPGIPQDMMHRSYAAGKRSASERAQDRRAACLELALGIVHGRVGREEQEKLGMIIMDGTDRREALSIIEDRALNRWDPSASFRARLETFSAAHGRWPEARSQDKEERSLASGVNLVRRLRFEDRMTFRKGILVDYYGALPDDVLDLWESASPLGPFFWWPQHADWYEQTAAVYSFTGELPKMRRHSGDAVLARNLRKVQHRRFAPGKLQMRLAERTRWEGSFPGIWRLAPAREVYYPSESFHDVGDLAVSSRERILGMRAGVSVC